MAQESHPPLTNTDAGVSLMQGSVGYLFQAFASKFLVEEEACGVVLGCQVYQICLNISIFIFIFISISIPDAEVAEPTENADDFVSWLEIMAI